jgi:rhodanese-related sulfurtransferase
MYETIDLHNLKNYRQRKRINLIDVREEDEFMFGHCHKRKTCFESFLRFCRRTNEDEPYYVICHSVHVSAIACALWPARLSSGQCEGGMAAL